MKFLVVEICKLCKIYRKMSAVYGEAGFKQNSQSGNTLAL